MAPISQRPNCALLNRRCYTLARSLTPTVPNGHRSQKPLLPELSPKDRVDGLGNFGKANGEFGTVERANEDDAVVMWDDDGRMRIRQPSLKKI
jgi:hypothetical protein